MRITLKKHTFRNEHGCVFNDMALFSSQENENNATDVVFVEMRLFMLFQEGERVKDLGKKHWNSPEALTRLKRLCEYLVRN